MSETKVRLYIKYGILLTTLVLTLLLASAFAVLTKRRSVLLRQSARKAMQTASLMVDAPPKQALSARALDSNPLA